MRFFSNDVRKSDSQVEAHMRGLEARIDGVSAAMKDLLALEDVARALLLSSNGARPGWSEAPSGRFDELETVLARLDEARS